MALCGVPLVATNTHLGRLALEQLGNGTYPDLDCTVSIHGTRNECDWITAFLQIHTILYYLFWFERSKGAEVSLVDGVERVAYCRKALVARLTDYT